MLNVFITYHLPDITIAVENVIQNPSTFPTMEITDVQTQSM
jgi:hypothetical protein